MFASKGEQRSVIHILVEKGVANRNVHLRMKAVYGEHALSDSCAGQAETFPVWARIFEYTRYATCSNSTHHHVVIYFDPLKSLLLLGQRIHEQCSKRSLSSTGLL